MNMARVPKTAARKKLSLRSGRPPFSSTSTSKSSTASTALSSKHTRSLISTHHVLQKRLATARSQNSTNEVQDLEAQLAAQGGLEVYQLASQAGQSKSRGGDSSQVLMQWLDGEVQARKAGLVLSGSGESELEPIRILEVGALSTNNALNIHGITTVRRLDLRSSDAGIEEIDFMDLLLPAGRDEDRPIEPEGIGEGYDVLSLSLVLNYVPDSKARGDMLRRTTLFYRNAPASHATRAKPQSTNDNTGNETHYTLVSSTPVLPCLFLVLPVSCLHNSRYLTPSHLTLMLNSLGYTHLHTKTTRKLHYSLWRFDAKRAESDAQKLFKKKELNPGGGRNNFCIVLQ